jgi:hypothetical protein
VGGVGESEGESGEGEEDTSCLRMRESASMRALCEVVMPCL